MLVGGPRIHLSPNFPSAVPRHGSLPNVAANVNLQVLYYQSLNFKDFQNNMSFFSATKYTKCGRSTRRRHRHVKQRRRQSNVCSNGNSRTYDEPK